MKKLAVLLISLLLMGSIFGGCGGSKDSSGGLSLDKIKKAAKDAGYKVTDDYQAAFLDDVSAGFSVEIIADDQDVIYSILECGSEESAIKNAKTIDDAGYNIAVRRGKILTFYNVDNKNGIGKDILISIVEGKPKANK
jgi:hypothetical protein